MLEFLPITSQSLETVAMSLVGVGTFLFYTYKKIQDIRGKSAEKKAQTVDPAIAAMHAEREAALRAERDESRRRAEELKTLNDDLREKVRGLSDDIQDLKSQLGLITELNRRLALALDAQRQLPETPRP